MSYLRAVEIADKLTADGVPAVVDPRSATPPCVLVTPCNRVYDLACGYTASWELWALSPGAANADAHKLLSDLVDDVANALPIERADLQQYVLSADTPALPAYRITFSEGVE